MEVVAVVASVISAFHGGAELIKLYKKRRAKKLGELQQREAEEEQRDSWLQDELQVSFAQGEMDVSQRFRDDQRALGQYSQLLRHGDYQAKEELLMVAVSLQAEVIQSLQQAAHNLEVIVEIEQLRAFHETAILKRRDAVRSISELRQRIEMTLPLPRLPAEFSLGMSRRTSNASLARTFIADVASMPVPPLIQRLLSVHTTQGRSQAPSRRQGHQSLMTMTSFQYLIPAIRKEDIDILTLAGVSMEHDEVDDTIRTTSTNPPELLPIPVSESFETSSSSTRGSEALDRLYDGVTPYQLPRIAIDSSGDADPDLPPPLRTSHTCSISDYHPLPLRKTSTPTTTLTSPLSEPDVSFRPRVQHPYCRGALAAQNDFPTAFIRTSLPTLPDSSRLCPSWKCTFCDFNACDVDGTLSSRIEFSHGVRFRFAFRARSHAPYTYPAGAFRPEYAYGCLFCTAEGKKSGVHEGSEALAAHVAAKHRTNLTPRVRERTKCVVDRLAGKEEGWDVNIPDVKSKSADGVWGYVVNAMTSLPR